MIGVLFFFLSLLSQPPIEETPQGLIGAFRSAWDSLRDYTCTVESYERLKDKEDFHRYEFRYLKPGWIWMKVIEGSNKGGQVSYNPFTKKVKGKKGGILGIIKLTLDPWDRRVTSIRGYRVDQSDWGTQLKRWEEYVNQYRIEVSEDTLDGEPVYILHATGIDPKKYDEAVEETLWLSKKLHLPLKLEAKNEKGVVFHRVRYRKVRINVGLKEEDFKI